MAYDEELADRIRTALRGRDDVVEKKMFGGLTFMVADKMACGVVQDVLMVRVGPDGHQAALAEPHTRPMDFTGRPMRGMVYVDPVGIASDADLAHWVDRAVTVATSAGSGRSTQGLWPNSPIEEHSFPLEDDCARSTYGVGSGINKVLIINADVSPGRISVVLIAEAIGF